MWIFYLNYPRSKRAKINILIIERRKLIGIDEIDSFKSFLLHLFHGNGGLLENFVGIKEEKDCVILHMRGLRSDIDYVLGELSRSGEFNIRQCSLTFSSLGYLKNCPYHRRRFLGSQAAYKKALDKVIPRAPLHED